MTAGATSRCWVRWKEGTTGAISSRGELGKAAAAGLASLPEIFDAQRAVVINKQPTARRPPRPYRELATWSRPLHPRHQISTGPAVLPPSMAWHDEDSWLTAAFAPKLSTIAFTFILAILLPILLHQFIYRKANPTTLPTFLLIGPSGGGKTALLTLVGPSHLPGARSLQPLPQDAACPVVPQLLSNLSD